MTSEIKAIIFDVDGTLYHQGPVRLDLLRILLSQYWLRPFEGLKILRALRAYRNALEVVRATDGFSLVDQVTEQTRLACELTGFDGHFLTTSTERWMEKEPLTVLPRYTREGLLSFLELARERGIRMAVFSDYPPEDKLECLGIRTYFELAISARDPEVRKYKPDPLGLQVTLTRLGIQTQNAIYVGDRLETDAEAARRLGMKCVIVGTRNSSLSHGEDVVFASFEELEMSFRSNRFPTQFGLGECK